MKKIAVPVLNGKLSGHFGRAQYFYVYDTADQKILSEEMHNPPEHVPGAYPSFLAEKGVTDVILGGVGQQAIQIFLQNGINTHIGAPELNVREIVELFITKKLELTANLCDSDHHDHDHEHHHH